MNERPDIYGYSDYREFLRDLFAYLKKRKRAFSFRFFSKEAGFSSPSTLKLVMDGKRNLTLESVGKFSRGLGLSKSEADFFSALVRFNQAQTTEEKSEHFQTMAKSDRFRKVRQIEHDQFEYFSHWYHPAIREMIALRSFKEDPAWIAKRLKPVISESDVKRSLKLLQKLGFVIRGGDGVLRVSDPVLSTQAEVRSIAVKNFHKEMCRRAMDSLDHTAPEARDISGITLSMPKRSMEELKKKIDDFRKDLVSSLASMGTADEIYHLNLQLFPLSQERKDDE